MCGFWLGIALASEIRQGGKGRGISGGGGRGGREGDREVVGVLFYSSPVAYLRYPFVDYRV